ncbi:MAG: hypothetical protein WAL83_10865 [Arenicellales bacterium]
MSDQSRRNILKAIGAGGAVVAGKSLPRSWRKPIVDSVVLPVHAQTSCGPGTTIRARSPFGENDSTERYIIIADESDNVLARCCCGGRSDIVIEAGCLPPGTYYVFGDSDSSIHSALNHIVEITTSAGTFTVSAPTYAHSCNLLIATVILPAGTVQQESGQTKGGNKCGDPVNCFQGRDLMLPIPPPGP